MVARSVAMPLHDISIELGSEVYIYRQCCQDFWGETLMRVKSVLK